MIKKAKTTMANKYYTAFVFGNDRPVLGFGHCTHKYFGELSDRQFTNVLKLCDQVFRFHQTFPQAKFSEVKHFGNSDNAVRVLTPHTFALHDWFPVLRSKLDPFKKDDFPYHPHVTTEHEDEIDRPFYGYALINSTTNTIVECWRNYGA